VFAISSFNPKAMSDDDLLARSNELMRKINWAQRFAGSGQGIQQMSQMLNLIENERRERLFMERWNMVESYASEPIETDPDLQAAAREARKANQKPAEKSRPRPRVEARRALYPTPTPHPVVPPTNPTKKEDSEDE